MLCKKTIYNDSNLELYTPFEFQLRTQSTPLVFFNCYVSSVGLQKYVF